MAGRWLLSDGALLEVGKLATEATVGSGFSNTWQPVTFYSDFGSAPAVVSQVQSNNDPHWVKTRQRNVTASGFQVALEEDDLQTVAHGVEEIGWLAISQGQSAWDGHSYKASLTDDAVMHTSYAISFTGAFGQRPRFIAGLATYDGGDGSYLRYYQSSLSSAGVDVFIEEDTTADEETGHTTERVAYLAVEGDDTFTLTAANAITTVTRSTYTAAGQPIAIKVSGHPDGDSNGLFHIHTDHLGSVSVLSKYSDGYVRWGSHAYYEPFGRYRLAPTKDITDRAFTGQRENVDWGLYYYNARYYVPGLGRFASADTIVPEPANPQSFNRYSYALNNPVKYRDPTGHCAEQGDDSCWEVYHQIWQFVMSNPERFFSDESSVWNDPNWWIDDLAARSEDDLHNVYDILISNVPESNGASEYGVRSPLDPDYVVVEGNLQIITFGFMRDRDGNKYGLVGLGWSGTPYSARVAMGGRLAEQVPIEHGLGLEWELNLSKREEYELERDLTGLSFGITGGFIAGADANATLRREPAAGNFELGLYTPQLSVGFSYGFLIYDAK